MGTRNKAGIIVCACTFIGGCSASDVDQAAGSFHDGYTASVSTLGNTTTALTSYARTKDTFSFYSAENSAAAMVKGVSEQAALNSFAQYVCEPTPNGLNKLKQGLGTLGQASIVIDPIKLSADKALPSKIQGIIAAQSDFPPLRPAAAPQASDAKYCESVVTAYMALTPQNLPSLDGGPGLKGAFLPSAVALTTVINAIWSATDTTLGFIEAEARADQLKRYIKNTATQAAALTAFTQIYEPDQAATLFCANTQNSSLCNPSVTVNPTTAAKQADDQKKAEAQPASAPPACFATINKTLYTPPKNRTILDSLTITERWSNLRLAWYSYYQLTNAPPGLNAVQTRRDLDQSISDYLSVPSTPDVAKAIVQAWAQLTYLANDCETEAQAEGELEVFAQNASSVLSAAQSVSNGLSTFETDVGPKSPAK